MKLQYRVIKRNDDFYPQVREKNTFLWGAWGRIGKHPKNSFGIYSSDNYNYGLVTFEEAEQICQDYNKWIKREKNAEIEVIPCNIK